MKKEVEVVLDMTPFVPDTYSETFAEMGNDIKNQISHRAEAVKKLTAFLSDYTF